MFVQFIRENRRFDPLGLRSNSGVRTKNFRVGRGCHSNFAADQTVRPIVTFFWQDASKNVPAWGKGAFLRKNVCGSFGTILNGKSHKILQFLFSHFCLMGKFQHIFTDYD